MKLLQGMKVTIGNTYAHEYNYISIVDTVCIYDLLYQTADDHELTDEYEVHRVLQVTNNNPWYVRKADIRPTEGELVTNEVATFFLRKEKDI